MKKITLIIGARPKFIKEFPVCESLKSNFELTLHRPKRKMRQNIIIFSDVKAPKRLVST